MSSFKMYYTATSCGAANFIAAKLAGLDFDSEQVVLSTHKTASGADFYKINPRGNVPALVFDDGSVFSENVATLLYIASQATTDAFVKPDPTSKEYFDMVDKLAYVNTEFHKAHVPLFYGASDVEKTKAKAKVVEKGKYFSENILAGKPFAMGDKPSVVDIYAYIVYTWGAFAGVDISDNKAAVEFMDRVKALPGVAAAHDEMNAAKPSA